VAGFCENDDPSGSMEARTFFDYVSNLTIRIVEQTA
jgi:hypothetical protein